MENMYEMINLKSSKNRNDSETGLIIKNNYLAQSGFQYLNGVREFGQLKIHEGVSKGTASIFLISVLVFDQNNVLIFDADIKKMTNYSREKVRHVVLGGMMNMLRESCENSGRYFDETETFQLLDKKLRLVYFKESYDAALQWAQDIGIEIYKQAIG